ncbi:MAG: hypothetical protein GX787_02235, partial [Tissierellia bacterium]|nr:hypothetical protein [Tissierellia bacterium]
MALSGSLTTRNFWDNTHSHRITWTATQDIPNNKSTVTAKFESKFLSNFGNYEEQAGANKIRLAGTTYTRSTYFKGTGNNTWTTQFTAVKVITHNADGTAKFKLGGQHRVNNNPGDYYYWNDVEFTLDTIPRNSTIGTISGSYLGSSVTVNINRASTAYRHVYRVFFPNISTVKKSYTNVAAGDASFSFVPSVDWGSSIPGASSGTAYIELQTYTDDNVKIGATVTKSFTLNVPSGPTGGPTIYNTYISEADPLVSAVTTSYIQSKSRLNIGFSANAAAGSTITSYQILANGQIFNSNSATTGILHSSGSNFPVVLKATDSRGNIATTQLSYSVSSYSPPVISGFSVHRSGPYTITVSANISWSQFGSSSPATIILRENSATVYETTSYNGSLNISLPLAGREETTSYTYSLTVRDNFYSSAVQNRTVGTAFQELTIRPGVGVGIGKIHEGGALDVGGNTYIAGSLVASNDLAVDGNIWEGGWPLSTIYATNDYVGSYFVPTTRTINYKNLGANIVLTASDVGAASSSHTHSGYASSSHTHSYLPLSGGTLTS